MTGVLEHMGVSLYQEPELIYVHSGQRLRAVSVKTGPYPAFPTDLQPFLMAALSRADGTSMLRETVFEFSPDDYEIRVVLKQNRKRA